MRLCQHQTYKYSLFLLQQLLLQLQVKGAEEVREDSASSGWSLTLARVSSDPSLSH